MTPAFLSSRKNRPAQQERLYAGSDGFKPIADPLELRHIWDAIVGYTFTLIRDTNTQQNPNYREYAAALFSIQSEDADYLRLGQRFVDAAKKMSGDNSIPESVIGAAWYHAGNAFLNAGRFDVAEMAFSNAKDFFKVGADIYGQSQSHERMLLSRDKINSV